MVLCGSGVWLWGTLALTFVLHPSSTDEVTLVVIGIGAQGGVRSDDESTPELSPPLQTSTPYQLEDVWPPTCDLGCKRPTCMADLKWNQVSNLELSGPEFETLPLPRS
ncbi:hypothetical protein AVEN_199734-1 [Araneus ventricosus]|uniref:Uncharacterized protein n=1 Tax=Araneus ventricosus TaxID=182803 RepID=A0A4Y2LHP8_ARAVE|nr:hypothetical protein AVEN_199734-1 [Araneus ventricosus]